MAASSQERPAALEELLRELGARAREDLRRRAAAGDRTARRALEDLGEAPPAPRHWSDGEDEEECR